MKKRFTDADKWEDGWFCEQPTDVKLFWIYLCDRCDHAGVWEVNWRLAKFHLPALDQRAIESALADKITPIKGGKAWFMPGFISFQYPIGLSNSSNAHRAIRTTMLSHGINLDNHQGTVQSRVQSTLQDKDKDKDKDKAQDMDMDMDMEKDMEKREEPAPRPKRFTPPLLDEVAAYCESRRNGIDAEQFMNRYESNGWLVGKSPMKNWQAAVRTWEKNGFSNSAQAPKPAGDQVAKELRKEFPDALKWTSAADVGGRLAEYGEAEVRVVLEIAKKNGVCFSAPEWTEAFEGRRSEYGGWDFWKPRKKLTQAGEE